jgi:pilus assembly protein CpaB
VLENILVLATGTQLEQAGEGKPGPVDVYTLEVTPEEGEILGLAATHGVLRFALKNTLDREVVLTAGATIPRTLASYSKKKPEPPVKKPEPPVKKKVRFRKKSVSTFTVEIIKNGEVTKKKIPVFPGGEK